MKRAQIVFLQVAIVLLGMSTIFFMLWEPHLEGRNAQATFSQIYFHDPFLVYAYLASIPFFVALYKAFNILEYVKQGKTFSHEVKNALRIIKYCATSLIVLIAIGEVFILLTESDDRAGGVAIGIVLTLGSLVIAASAAKLERLHIAKNQH